MIKKKLCISCGLWRDCNSAGEYCLESDETIDRSKYFNKELTNSNKAKALRKFNETSFMYKKAHYKHN